jgi:hypothetical protein
MKTLIRVHLATPQGAFGSLHIAERLAPPIFKDDIGERHTANRPEPAYRVADRKQSIGVEAGRKAHSSRRTGVSA